MDITKCLYRRDEVNAALLYCIKQGRILEAFFWLEELEESFYGNDARRTLFLSWLMNNGLESISWLELWATIGTTKEGRRTLCAHLLRCKKYDSSIWWLLWSSVIENTELFSELPEKLWSIWHNSCRKSYEDFWQEQIDSSDDERIDTILSSLQDDMKTYSIFAKAAAVCIIYSYKTINKSSWELNQIDTIVSMCPEKSSAVQMDLQILRAYSIPYDCLYCMTARGNGQTTTEELQSLGEKQFIKSAYWKMYWPGKQNDDAYEAFWDTYFPTDHPDEWSRTQKEKSHGHGVPVGPLQRWWRNWVRQDCYIPYDAVHKNILKWVEDQRSNVGGTVIHRLIELYK
jgi:hypothetical protein